MTQKKWTDDEIAALKDVDPDSTTWKVIAEGFPGRSHASCRQKWLTITGDTNEGDWSRDEDDWLCYAMSITNKWPKIATIVGTRKQCLTRWQRMGEKGLAIKCSAKPSGRPALKKTAKALSTTPDDTVLDVYAQIEAMDLNWSHTVPAPIGPDDVVCSFASMDEIAMRLPAEAEMAPVDMAPTPDEPLSQAEVDYWSAVVLNSTQFPSTSAVMSVTNKWPKITEIKAQALGSTGT
ncbi:hypothetical protein SDRG_08139 [Saprolegnia diclina VS20]|uniref:Myb-like domain-containing protein n=1 Tax=Saprolegnia diclina (strain VS20) TaxID=1156394 RepID=T0RPE8_SAPDV|nr:hypothetical protein SDRG_08139 [Saprolegnia diclina VS20]EQC34368.1 hypothetical protein SDRG_08139 [Saprolegnia diclina VS20]|eukprot:XP_008612230.1 hypothetical protein SDRG_08139 [Saprolegnia diclina VS20]